MLSFSELCLQVVNLQAQILDKRDLVVGDGCGLLNSGLDLRQEVINERNGVRGLLPQQIRN